MRKLLFPIALFAILLTACTPKTTEPVVQPKPEEPVQPSVPKECAKFADLSVRDKDIAETNFVLYRDFLKIKDWPQAFDYWQKAYAMAPAATGERPTMYTDGILFYEHFISESKDTAKYLPEIEKLYAAMEKCFGQGGYIQGLRAFDYYYKYPNKPREEVYALFKASFDADYPKVRDFIINPFTAVLVDLYFKEKIPMMEAQQYAAKIKEVVAAGMANCKDKECERWRIIDGYAPVLLENFETVENFYDCDYYSDKYYSQFEENPTNCDVIREVYGQMRWGRCSEANERFKKVVAAGNTNCVVVGPLQKAYQALQDARYREAVKLFLEASETEKDKNKKGEILLLVSKIYYGHYKDFPNARRYALQAADVRPNWGEPFILIGRLYASSGPLCGPGQGWDSQIVTWPAIDMWNRAKRVDPGVAAEANKWINRYSQYMPTREDVFLRNLTPGSSFKIGCWIQETTTIRTAD